MATILGRRWSRAAGFGRSLLIYYGQPWRIAAMRRHYAALIEPGDLVFDIGAHVGNQTPLLAGLGARVVAIEPQPQFARWLRWLFRGEPRVVVVETALGARPGTASLYPSPRTPTVATLSSDWIASVGSATIVRRRALGSAARGAGDHPGCADRAARPAALLQDRRRGLRGGDPARPLAADPAAVVRVRAGGDRASPARRSVCWRRSAPTASTRRSASGGGFRWPDWQEPAAILAWLRARRPDERSGDVYARLESSGTS